jgi:two-component system response regulator DesR
VLVAEASRSVELGVAASAERDASAWPRARNGTPREREVLNAAADGATVTDISARTHPSGSRVRNHLSDAIGKTGTRNRREAVRVARENGWL